MYCPALLFGDGLGRRLPAIWNEVGQTRCQATSLRECLKPSFHLTFSALVTGGERKSKSSNSGNKKRPQLLQENLGQIPPDQFQNV